MKYFEQYTSNTYAGSGNQLYFHMRDGETRTGRVFYKIAVGGEYHYSILFSNIMDSTYSDGSVSHKNLICESWTILEARVGKCSKMSADKIVTEMTVADEGEGVYADILVTGLQTITFSGQSSKEVMPGEFFSSDPIKLSFERDEYLCLEITFAGKMIPYHEETLLPVFVKDNDGWKYAKHMPFAGMIGCDRKVKGRIAFIGDSITQGIGTQLNSYAHWNAKLARKIGEEYAFWNLGIGYGRANDAASDGAWLFKARQNDIIFVCYGVNDIMRGMSEEQIKKDLTAIVDNLKNAGKKVVLQTVPPFHYAGDNIKKWESINLYIKTVLRDKVDMIFDNVPYLGESEQNKQAAKYGGHPNEEGCTVWAEALYEELHKGTLF